MSEEKETNVLTMARQRAAIRQQRAAAASSQDILNAERMLQLADTIIEHNNLIIDSSKEAKEAGAAQIYRVISNNNTLEAVSDEELDTLIFQAEPLHKTSGRIEVASFIRKHLLTSKEGTRARNMDDVAALAFADEPEVLCFKRFEFTKEQAHAIKIEDIPAFKYVLDLTSDPRALTLWIGSLLDWKSARIQYLHWHGGGGNGKSTVFDAIQSALGDRIVTRADLTDILEKHWGKQLIGARLLLVPDTNYTRAFSHGKWKTLTGERYLTINPKNEHHRQIRLMQKIAVISNKKVAINRSAADTRRVLPITSLPDPLGDVPFKWWYAPLLASGEKILLYCYSQWAKAVEKDPELAAGIPAQQSAIDDAVEELYGDMFDVIEEALVINPNAVLPISAKCSDVYKRIADVRGGRDLSQKEKEEFRDALKSLGVEKVRKKTGRYYAGCSVKAEAKKT